MVTLPLQLDAAVALPVLRRLIESAVEASRPSCSSEKKRTAPRRSSSRSHDAWDLPTILQPCKWLAKSTVLGPSERGSHAKTSPL